MTQGKPDWQSVEGLAVGKGTTVQAFVARSGEDTLEIDVAPWGEGHFKVNGRLVPHIGDTKRSPQNLAQSYENRRTLRRDQYSGQREQKDYANASHRKGQAP